MKPSCLLRLPVELWLQWNDGSPLSSTELFREVRWLDVKLRFNHLMPTWCAGKLLVNDGVSIGNNFHTHKSLPQSIPVVKKKNWILNYRGLRTLNLLLSFYDVRSGSVNRRKPSNDQIHNWQFTSFKYASTGGITGVCITRFPAHFKNNPSWHTQAYTHAYT